MTTVLRKELQPKSAEVARLKHGDKVELIERRRRFVRVRVAGDRIGWMDSRQLLTAAQMEELRQLAVNNRTTPRVGQVTVFEALNLHNEPNRSSPSFAQIPDKGIADLIGYRAAPRVPYQPPPLIEDRKPDIKPAKKKKKKSKGKDKDDVEPLPPPPAPEPPDDWLDLSLRRGDGPPETASPENAVKTDSWGLVRLADGRVGWALSSMLMMAIPDDVAQYSEGHRIIGYWPVAESDDEGVKKSHWLWVTQSQKNVPFDFDGFRVFLYNARRHRYEQAYREKNVRGFLPVDVVRPGSKPEYLAEYSIITENEEGKKIRRTFAYMGYRVLKLGESEYAPPAVQETKAVAPVAAPKVEAERPWYRRWF